MQEDSKAKPGAQSRLSLSDLEISHKWRQAIILILQPGERCDHFPASPLHAGARCRHLALTTWLGHVSSDGTSSGVGAVNTCSLDGGVAACLQLWGKSADSWTRLQSGLLLHLPMPPCLSAIGWPPCWGGVAGLFFSDVAAHKGERLVILLAGSGRNITLAMGPPGFGVQIEPRLRVLLNRIRKPYCPLQWSFPGQRSVTQYWLPRDQWPISFDHMRFRSWP
jgi:hypothetical protein